MTPETVTLIRYRVARAGEALAEATLLLAYGLRGCIRLLIWSV